MRQPTRHGGTALLVAVWKGRIAAVRFLLERGAAVNHAMGDGKTALMIAARGAGPTPALTHLRPGPRPAPP